MTSKSLVEIIPYRRTVWMTGFVKTTLSSSLIATGVTLIFSCLTNHPLFKEWNEIGLILGVLAIVAAIVIIISIDKWKELKKKEELATIDEKFKTERDEIKAEREQMKIDFHDEAVKIAKELVQQELQSIEKEL